MKLLHKVAAGLILGIIFGIIVRNKVAWFPDYVTFIDIIFTYMQPLGNIFFSLIKMIIVPLIFFAIITGITSVTDSKILGRLGYKAALSYMLTTAFAILIGITISLLFHPGIGINLGNINVDANRVYESKSVIDILLNIVPDNALKSMVDANVVQVVFFAIFTGVTINAMGESGKKIMDLCQVMSQMVFKMIGYIIQLAPYASFALIAWAVGTQGYDVLKGLIKFVMCVLFAMALQYGIFGILIKVFGRISPMPFYRKSIEYQLIAFATSSTKATLATAMSVCQNKLGISKTSTAFILPLGASINMNGMAIYLGMGAVFFAQAFNIQLTAYDYTMIMLTTTLGSIGVAGIPSGSLIMFPMVLSSIHVPIEGIAIIAGIDRILDMVRTTINLTGDATVTLIIDKSEGNLDEDVYNS